MLGEAQWSWLEQRLREPADVRLLVSSIQLLAESHGWERWGNLPLERQRLIRLIGDTGAGGVVILSGDRHFGGYHRRTADAPYPLVEVTASSFNRPRRDAREHDVLQLNEIVTDATFGLVRIDWRARQIMLELHAGDDTTVRTLPVAFSAPKG